ncbi:hypothetical protein [Caedibacter taeniospiralis]|uniref:hypothetical protein n=1 Tax=Caedibacter taeniospiralis TaxID=28907 RepID=UPI0037BF144B
MKQRKIPIHTGYIKRHAKALLIHRCKVFSQLGLYAAAAAFVTGCDGSSTTETQNAQTGSLSLIPPGSMEPGGAQRQR